MTERTSRLAVKAVEEACLRADWFFREQPITDQGIDAHIEKFELQKGQNGDDEVGTGRLIALQIKGGPSYFRRLSPNGWWFPFKARKAKLWLGHALPVLVVLVDLDSGQMYWQRVSAATVIRTGKNYKIEVPLNQTIAGADAEWREIASGLEQHAVSRFAYSLLSVPPSVRTILESRSEGEKADAALLAMHLSEGRTNALGTVRSLLATSPIWITRNADWAWRAIAAYASDHALTAEAATAFRRAAAATDDDRRRSRDLVSAALLLQRAEPRAALAILVEVEALKDSDKVYVAIARTVFSREQSEVRPWALDPLLAQDIPEVTQSVAAQRLLAMQARRSDDLDAAVEHGRQALRLDQTSDETKMQLAESLLTRWSQSGSSSSDLHDATSLLRAVIEQRRTWCGPISELIEHLARAYGFSGQFEALLKLTLPPPHGTAEPKDLDRNLVRMAAYAARSLDRLDVVAAACDLLGQEPADQLIRADVGVLELDNPEVAINRLQAFEKALNQGDHEDVARHAISLALEGVDVRDRLDDLVERSIIPDRVVTLASALLTAHGDLDSALPTLRELAKTDTGAAEHLIGLLRRADRHQEAANVAASLFEITGQEAYLIHQANCLIDAGGGPAAVKAAEAAIAHTTIRLTERSRLLTFLGATAADHGDWATAEQCLTQVLNLFESPTDSAVWRLVTALTGQGRIKKAAKVIATYRPEVRSRDEAEAWLRSHATLKWNERVARDAYSLAERFDDDPQLSTALLGHIVSNTHGVGHDETESGTNEHNDIDELDHAELEERRTLAQDSVPGDLHRRAFELMIKLAEKHGDRTGIKVLKGTNTDDLAGQIVETLKNAAQVDSVLADLVEQARASRVPLGLLAGVMSRGYATIVIQRAMGVLVAGSPDDAEHEIETAAAREQFNREIVVDASAVVTLTGLSDPNRLTGRYLSIVTPPAAMLGLHRAAFDIRGLAGSPGSIRWDPERDGIAMTELGEQEFMRLFERSERVQGYTDRVQVRAVTKRTALAQLANEREHAEWVDVLQLALERQLPIWSDDLGLRRIARGLGLSSFGTPAVVDAIRDLAIENSTDTEVVEEAISGAFDTHIELAADMIVDLPLGTEGLLRVAEADGWKARAGAVALARPAWWVANPDGTTTLRRIYGEARKSAPDDLSAWQFAAMYGTARALQPEAASAVLAMLAMLAYDEDEPKDETRLDGLRRARHIAADLGHPDPASAVRAAAAALAESGQCTDPEQLAARILEALDSSN